MNKTAPAGEPSQSGLHGRMRPTESLSRPLADSRQRKLLMGIIALGALLRIGICFFAHLPVMHHDSFEYFKQADTLLAGGYTDFFPNGYPLMIAAVKALTPAHTIGALLLVQIAMSAATIWFAYDMGARLSGNVKTGLIAAALLAIFPSQINYVRWLTTEVPTAFFLFGGFFFYLRKQYSWAGLFLGYATLVRSNVSPVFLLLFIAHFIHYRREPLLQRIPLKLIGATLLPLLAIGFYCQNKTGKFSTAGNNQINILYAVTASGSYIDFGLADKMPGINTTGKAVHLYIEHAKADPTGFIKQKLANYWELWGFFASSANGGRGIGSRLLLGAGNLFLLAFGLTGWWMQRRNFNVALLILPFVIVTILHTMLFAMPRYTYPVEPFLLLLAAFVFVRPGSDASASKAQ